MTIYGQPKKANSFLFCFFFFRLFYQNIQYSDTEVNRSTLQTFRSIDNSTDILFTKKKIKSKIKFLVNDGVSMRPHVCGVNIQMWICILKVKIGICLKLWTNQFHQIKCFNGMCDGALQSKAILQTLFNMNFSEGPLKCNILHWAFAHLPLLIRLHVGAHEPLR